MPDIAKVDRHRDKQVVVVRAGEDWKAWVLRLNRAVDAKVGVRLPVGDVVTLALAEYARSIGFDEPMPIR